MIRFLRPTLLTCTLALILAAPVLAQSVRPQRTLYIQPRVGVTHYIGDFGEFGDFSSDYGNPIGFGGEIGYQFSSRFSIGAAYLVGDYPTIIPRDADGVIIAGQNDYSWRHTANLFLKWTFMGSSARVAPFIQIGLNGTVGQTLPAVDVNGNPHPEAGEDMLGIGPSAGIGVDFVLSNRLSLIVELISNMVVPDEAADSGDGINDTSYDLLNFLGLGLKYSFKSAFTAVDVVSVSCPANLMVNETGTFSASVDARASSPVEYRWNFGDGATATGTSTTHSFDQAGTYAVTLTGTNDGSTDSESCQVVVEPLPVSAEIVSISANPMSFQVCEPVTVQFTANVRGDEPLSYAWDFGDGSTGTGSSASHTYTEPGNYQVTLTLSNAEGSVERSITVQALECEADICDDITDLNSVYFGQNSSTLTAEARAALQENIEILRECPDICVRIEGYAAPGERNPQQLSEDRARAVEQFYIDNGVAASRLLVTGMGRVAGTSKKEGAAQYRRVDSIPVPCEDLGE